MKVSCIDEIYFLIFSNIGVVGIDTPLSHVERIIDNALWGTTYAFMIDSRDGSTIIHPFAKPTAEVSCDVSLREIRCLFIVGKNHHV